MSTTAHTPGPWHRNIPPAAKYPTVWAGRNTHVAVVVRGAPQRSGNGETMPDDEVEANINLIAAAPDLLETVKVLLKKHEAHHNSIEHSAARALVAKVEASDAR